ncbi:acyl-CoA dehydrogenase family protein [Agrobacterium larrymoorei]|uniref:Alkylation response protein AidB-like acyl-CoA dehydrogenase n=1 Tax=Agrobacterium larrymoorei TaxID=160699 RepID=A0ABU0UFK3_9HYPH|nr:acyl-CoA dehydrogenase family protein [Agrobacterium larrymoorei]MDQ1183721.1 alkylation response protein AidB-like acyl-CoA dehydrogenase [Agrobacterium larrymoorei]
MDQVSSPNPVKPVTLAATLDEIRARRHEFEALGHIPLDMVEKLQAIGCYRAFVPKELGGDALSPAEFCALIETLSQADASTGWVASFGVSATYLSALPPETFRAIYAADPDSVFAGALFPPQPARRIDGGLSVSGRWKYCSGCMGASLIGAGVTLADGAEAALPRMAIMPRAAVRIEQTWKTTGLAGTGSHDIVAEDVHVPEDWTFVRGGPSRQDAPAFRYPAMALAAQVLAVVSLGAAREALDHIRADAGRVSITGGPTTAARPWLQADFARSEATLRALRSVFYDTIDEAWQCLLRGDSIDRDLHTRLRLVATQAAHGGADVARAAFYMGGTGAIAKGHILSRTMMDTAAVAQHAFMAEGTWTAAGAALLNQPTMPGYP